MECRQMHAPRGDDVYKILHTADIHLDAPLRSLALRDDGLQEIVRAATRTAFTRLVDFALSEGVGALLISGDLFDGQARSATTAAFLLAQFDRLRHADIAIYYVRGNHDAENPISGELTFPNNVHVFDGRGGIMQISGQDIYIHGVSYSGRHAPDSLLPRFSAPVPDAINIAMLHSSLSGAAGHDSYAPCSVQDLTRLGFDYWALGHVHKRQIHNESPWIVMPGMPQGRDIGEAGPKSATLVTVADGKLRIEEVATAAVEFMHATVDVSESTSDDAIRAQLRSVLAALQRDMKAEAAILRLTLSGVAAQRWQILRDQDIWTETIVAFARSTGRLWIEKVSFELTSPPAIRRDEIAIDELADIMQQIVSEEGFMAAITETTEMVLAELRTQRRAAFMPDPDAVQKVAKQHAETGAQRLLAAMRGSAQ
jgi:DNA repair exonuclease SbcCD nuclease subunit